MVFYDALHNIHVAYIYVMFTYICNVLRYMHGRLAADMDEHTKKKRAALGSKRFSQTIN